MNAFLTDMLASVGGVAGLVAVLGFILKIWPGAASGLATWLYSHIDPDRIPYGSAMNAHWAATRELIEGQQDVRRNLADLDEAIRAENRELRKDSVKNVILSLMADKSVDHSAEIRYELAKLEDLDADCWVVDAARDYITAHLVPQPTGGKP